MNPKTELLVFKRKEIFLIIILFVLVGLFSFTLGLKMGKQLAINKAAVGHSTSEQPPLDAENHHKAEHEAEHVATESEHEAAPATHEHEETKAEPKEEHKLVDEQDNANKAEDVADAELAHEIEKEKLAPTKKVAMSYPSAKKVAKAAEAPHEEVEAAKATQQTPSKQQEKFTLQVGAFKTETEANERVTVLKEAGLDAFYYGAKVPGKGTWYRVGIGKFETKETAEDMASKWRAEKTVPPYIVQRMPADIHASK